MSGLLIRWDTTEHVLRSVGDPPNGIVCMGTPDDVASWLIDAQFDPARAVAPVVGLVTLQAEPSETGAGPDSTVVPPADLVAACEGPAEAGSLVMFLASALGYACQKGATNLHYEFIATHVDLALATRAALIDAGYLNQGGER